MAPPDVLLEQIERDVIRYSSFKVRLSATSKGTEIECDMDIRGPLRVYVERRDGHWVMSDLCVTVRRYSYMWTRHRQEVEDICQLNSVMDTLGELWLYIDADHVFMSLCSMLCAMIEIETKYREYRKGER